MGTAMEMHCKQYMKLARMMKRKCFRRDVLLLGDMSVHTCILWPALNSISSHKVAFLE